MLCATRLNAFKRCVILSKFLSLCHSLQWKKNFAVNFFCRITFIFGLFVAFERRNRMLKLCQEKANKFYGLLVNETIKLKKNRLSLEVAKTIDIFFYRFTQVILNLLFTIYSTKVFCLILINIENILVICLNTLCT